MPSPHVLVLYNEPILPPDHPNYFSESDVLDTADFVVAALTQAGYRASRLGLTHDPGPLLDFIRRQRPDAVFNLFEGTVIDGQNEAYLAGLLEWLGLPYTGCPAQALSLARNKSLAKYLLQGASLPTAPFCVITEEAFALPPIDGPIMVKPGQQDASEGIDQQSVVRDERELRERVTYLLRTYGPPVLAEQFIPGRELIVALVEDPDLQVLTFTEVHFVDEDPSFWPIVTYDAKWRRNTRDYDATPVSCPAEVEPDLARCLGELAKRAFRLLGCRDYARVDFRVTPQGQPYILEVNPNPDFSPSGGFSVGLKVAGRGHEAFAVALAERALARRRK